jgi:hypothetical protein
VRLASTIGNNNSASIKASSLVVASASLVDNNQNQLNEDGLDAILINNTTDVGARF